MASIKDIIEGLQILAKTAEIPLGLAEQGVTDGRQSHLGGADHDIIWGPKTDPNEQDKARLNELGWHFDYEADCWARFV